MKRFINQNIFLINKNAGSTMKNLKFGARNLIILPLYLGETFLVHNGKIFTKVNIVKEMIGHKLGEFVKTMKTFKFKK